PDQFRFPQQANSMRGKHRRIEYSLKEGPHDARSKFEPAIENRLKSQVDEQGKARQVIPMQGRSDRSDFASARGTPEIQFREIISRLKVSIDVPTNAAEIGSIAAKPAK